jgi:flagellar biosynthetic protein FliQ
MTADSALGLAGQALWVSLQLLAPPVGLALVVGLGVSVAQVVTQVQESTISFVVKLVAVAGVLFAFGPWMLRKLVGYAQGLIGGIPSMLQ